MNPICPYCRMEAGDAEGERKDCPTCGTPHHADCFAENGGCTVFGCASAPSDEAKITVSGTDLSGNVITRQVSAQVSGPAARPVARPGLSLGSSYTTFRAPVPAAPAPVVQPVPETTGAPPPPPMAGTGVAPPPQAASAAPQAQRGPMELAQYYDAPRRKTRVIFVLLGIFLGIFGLHNFYAGYTKKGAIQLCATVMIGFWAAVASWLWVAVWLWAITEICFINMDADGTQFE